MSFETIREIGVFDETKLNNLFDSLPPLGDYRDNWSYFSVAANIKDKDEELAAYLVLIGHIIHVGERQSFTKLLPVVWTAICQRWGSPAMQRASSLLGERYWFSYVPWEEVL